MIETVRPKGKTTATQPATDGVGDLLAPPERREMASHTF